MPDRQATDSDAPAYPIPPSPATPQHTVTLTLDKGWASWLMECPFDMGDPARPCWPCEENGERMDATARWAMVCNWAEWFAEGGDVEQVYDAPKVSMPVLDADWTGDHFRFFLGAGHFGDAGAHDVATDGSGAEGSDVLPTGGATTERCPACEGSGWWAPEGCRSVPDSYDRCPTCDGTGVLPTGGAEPNE